MSVPASHAIITGRVSMGSILTPVSVILDMQDHFVNTVRELSFQFVLVYCLELHLEIRVRCPANKTGLTLPKAPY